MTYLRVGFLTVLGIVLLVVAFANIGPVRMQLLPSDVAAVVGWNYSADVPLFIAIFAGILVGLAIGFVWEWLRESRHRARAARDHRELARLSHEAGNRRGQAAGPADDILAILDKPKP